MKVRGLMPGPYHRVVSIDKLQTLLHILSLHPGVYWVPAIYCWGYPCDGLASHPEGSSNTLSCFMLQKPG